MFPGRCKHPALFFNSGSAGCQFRFKALRSQFPGLQGLCQALKLLLLCLLLIGKGGQFQ